jgi:hypothetical protein
MDCLSQHDAVRTYANHVSEASPRSTNRCPVWPKQLGHSGTDCRSNKDASDRQFVKLNKLVMNAIRVANLCDVDLGPRLSSAYPFRLGLNPFRFANVSDFM